jgi:hypothetical protein
LIRLANDRVGADKLLRELAAINPGDPAVVAMSPARTR